MTYDDLVAAINAARPGDALATAERLLAEYASGDRDLIEPDIMEAAIVIDSAKMALE